MSLTVVMVGIQHVDGVQLLGTCFALPKKGLFATCRHVVGDRGNNLVLVFPENPSCTKGYQDTSNPQCKFVPVMSIEDINPLCDLAILKANVETKVSSPIGGLNEVGVGDEVEILGFPHCVNDWQMHVLTLQKTMVGAKILRESQGLKFKYAILNIQTRPGQSGSLVYCPRLQKIVGILVGGYAPASGIILGGINPHELNQTSFCLSAEYINEMLEE